MPIGNTSNRLIGEDDKEQYEQKDFRENLVDKPLGVDDESTSPGDLKSSVKQNSILNNTKTSCIGPQTNMISHHSVAAAPANESNPEITATGAAATDNGPDEESDDSTVVTDSAKQPLLRNSN